MVFERYYCVQCKFEKQDNSPVQGGLCPLCGSILIRDKLPGIYLGVPHKYPEEKPTRGRYLTWVANKSTSPREFWNLTWYENELLGFGARDKQVTHWLPMPPEPDMPTRKDE